MIPIGVGGGISSSTSDQLASTSGITQSFGGINKSVTGIDTKTLTIGVVLVALFYFASKKKARRK